MTQPPAPPAGCPVPHGPAPLSGPRFQTEPTRLYREMRRDHGAVAPVVLGGDVPAWLVLKPIVTRNDLYDLPVELG